jgi:ferredoxin-NADP reductase
MRFVCQTKSGGSLVRSYTPIVPEPGFLNFAIKHYPSAPKSAKKLMSAFLYNLGVGAEATVSGPYRGPPALDPIAWSDAELEAWTRFCSPNHPSPSVDAQLVASANALRKQWLPERVGMICAGTGLAPMLQVLDFIFDSTGLCQTRAALLYANRTVQDILFERQLNECVKAHPKRVRVTHCLSQVWLVFCAAVLCCLSPFLLFRLSVSCLDLYLRAFSAAQCTVCRALRRGSNHCSAFGRNISSQKVSSRLACGAFRHASLPLSVPDAGVRTDRVFCIRSHHATQHRI